MDSEAANASSCVCFYCGSHALKLTHTGVYHKYKPGYGPFDFYECTNCGSGITYPMPSNEALAALYQGYSDGLPEATREDLGPEGGELWHGDAVKRIGALKRFTPASPFTWIEMGAGAGEMARLMSESFPNAKGLAADLHEHPAKLPANVEWKQIDLNLPTFHELVDRKADVVYATGVWEHVQRPDLFAQNMIKLLNPSGLFYLLCPNYDSLARKILDTKWPYFTPGEHLTMPTPKGALACFKRITNEAGLFAVQMNSRPRMLSYSIYYTAKRFGLPFANLIPRSLAAPLPSGALENWAIIAP